MTSATVRQRPAARRIPSVPLVLLPALSLLATAAMAAEMAAPDVAVALLPAAVWAAGLFAVAAVVAAAGRTRGGARFALEPFTMGLMVVLAALHGHDGTASGAAVTASGDPHAAHLSGSWVLLTVAIAVAALTVVCLACAVRLAATHGIVAALLPVASTVAMCAMTTWMLVA